MEDPIVKTCSCKRTYTQAEWERLPARGLHEFEWGEVQELRNCSCGSTITVLLKKGWPEIPGGVYLQEEGKCRKDCVEATVQGYPVHFYKGASLWRVCVLGEKGTDGSGDTIPLITPHVFEYAEEGYAWLVKWLAGEREWDRSWGLRATWPSMTKAKRGFRKWTPRNNFSKKRPRDTRFSSI